MENNSLPVPNKLRVYNIKSFLQKSARIPRSLRGCGGIGPKLIGVGKKYDAAKLASLLTHPTPAMTAGGMPPVDLKPEELDALIAYLQSLQ
jgi:hypothetical protein